MALCALASLGGCEMLGGDSSGGASTGARIAESGTKRGSAGGFSATMSAELGAPEGSGSLGAAAPGAATDDTAAGSAMKMTATPTEPEGSAAGSPAPAGSAAPVPAETPAGSAAAADSTAPAVVDPAAGSGASAPPVTPAKAPTGTLKNRVLVKPSAELAAIKLELEPNWERDIGEAGTFSLVVKIPSTDEMRVFSVRYGYEDSAAPFDCDQYRKFLDDKKLMKVSLNRQRGAACYVEGKDPAGVDSYRFLVNYGGKRLICHGSLYADAKPLGDLRDKVLMQAKKICETLSL